jgi:quercetin dioxygenase-like cupin family protein
VFNQKIEFQIKFIEPGNEVHQLGAPEPVNVRMFCCINEEDDEYFRIELTSDNDVFFFYAHM